VGEGFAKVRYVALVERITRGEIGPSTSSWGGAEKRLEITRGEKNGNLKRPSVFVGLPFQRKY